MAGHAKVYTLAEVSKHNSSKDCWLVIHGKVYDVTKFLEDHPGGDEVLRLSTGKDATDDFECIGHSTSAKAMMDEYYVGEIDAATIPKEVVSTPTKQPNYNPGKTSEYYVGEIDAATIPKEVVSTRTKQPNYNPGETSEFVVKILQVLVPLLILGFAIGIRYYTKSA